MKNVIIFVLIGLLVCGVAGGYYIGNNQGYTTGYKQGYNTGHISGYSEGLETGYKTGYSNGTKDGYSQGHSVGYTSGDTAGYTRGYTVGYNAGNTQGYSTGFSTGKTEGYTLGFAEGYSTTGYTIRDPTYAEMLTFISVDKTDSNTYVSGSYVCNDFSIDVKRNAFNAGYRSFWVYIQMEAGMVPVSHALVAFNTTDRGIAFVEPQEDRIMNVVVGQPYWNRLYYSAPDYDDTVTKIILVP